MADHTSPVASVTLTPATSAAGDSGPSFAPAVPALQPGTAIESALSESRYAVPITFLWLADVLVQSIAFPLARPLALALRELATAGHIPWQWLAPAPALGVVRPPPFSDIAWIPLVMAPVTLMFVQALGGYRPLLEQSRTRVLLTSLLAPFLGLSVVSLVAIAVRNPGISRALIFSFALLTAGGLLAYRCAIRYYKTRRLRAGMYARNVLVVARQAARERLYRHFASHISPNAYRLAGYLQIREQAPPPPEGENNSRGPGQPACLGDVGDLGALLVHRPIHEVVAVQGSGADLWLREVIEQCEYFGVTLRLVPEELLAWQSRELPLVFRTGAFGLPEIVLRPRYLDHDGLFVKRVFDIIVSGPLLLLLSPIFLVIAVAIKLTTPQLPVFYPWRVIGFKGRPFTGYKFTTMRADADERKQELSHLNEMTGPVFKIKDDPRVTPLGRWLRKFSLNELPQLWSVLKGDMSLVGPRPAGPHELARYELWQKRKLCVQPGITCLWQVRGRNKISHFDDWVRMDFEYIDKWSLWLDCRILLRTAWTVLAGTGS